MGHTIKIDNITYQVSAELAAGINKVLQEVAQEQVDKEWEIVEWKGPGGIYVKRGNEWLSPIDGETRSTGWITDCGQIHAIRISTDGIIYRVGDTIGQKGCTGNYTIKGFIPDTPEGNKHFGGVAVELVESTGTQAIGQIEHREKPKPLLVTQDGKSITLEEQDVYAVHDTTWNTIEPMAKYANQYKYKEWHIFSSAEARTEYIVHQKPVLSMQDVLNIPEIVKTVNSGVVRKQFEKELEELVKSKIKG